VLKTCARPLVQLLRAPPFVDRRASICHLGRLRSHAASAARRAAVVRHATGDRLAPPPVNFSSGGGSLAASALAAAAFAAASLSAALAAFLPATAVAAAPASGASSGRVHCRAGTHRLRVSARLCARGGQLGERQ